MTLADNLHVLFAMPELLAFVLLWQRRTAQMRRVAQTQSVVVAILAALKAWLTHTPSSVALALVCTVAGGLALLSVLRGQHAADLPPSPRALIASSILVVLLLLALHQHEDLALALGAALVGVVVCATRRAPIAQLIGLWSIANATALTATLAPSPASVAAVLGLFAFVAIGRAILPTEARGA